MIEETFCHIIPNDGVSDHLLSTWVMGGPVPVAAQPVYHHVRHPAGVYRRPASSDADG